MKSRDIALANLNHTPAPRPAFFYSGDRMNDFLSAHIKSPKIKKGWTEGQYEYYYDVYGNLWHRIIGKSQKGETLKVVLPTWDDLDKLEMPEYFHDEQYADMKELFSKDSDKLKVAHIGGWIFDNARYLRGLDNYLMDILLQRDKIIELNNRVAKTYEDKINMVGQLGAEAIFIGEDLGTQTGPLFGPKEYEEMFLPTYKRLLDLAHSYGMKVFLHSCGQNSKLLDLMIEAGFDAFQFDQPAVYDYDQLSLKLHQHKRTLFSPVDIQKVLPTGDREFIESETIRMFNSFKGCLIVKDYPDLHGIGVESEWDDWAYQKLLELSNLK